MCVIEVFVLLLRYFMFFLMRRRPPRYTRTDTLFPYTTLFRSGRSESKVVRDLALRQHEVERLDIAAPFGLGQHQPTRSTGHDRVKIGDRKSTRLNSSH